MSRLEINLSLTALMADCKLANSCVRSPVCLFVHICRDFLCIFSFVHICRDLRKVVHFLFFVLTCKRRFIICLIFAVLCWKGQMTVNKVIWNGGLFIGQKDGRPLLIFGRIPFSDMFRTVFAILDKYRILTFLTLSISCRIKCAPGSSLFKEKHMRE